MKIATDYDHGTPQYTTTVREECNRIIKMDAAAQNATMAELAETYSDQLGRPVAVDDCRILALSDAFFNCEAINEADSTDVAQVRKAARLFRMKMHPIFRELFSEDWLVADFFARV